MAANPEDVLDEVFSTVLENMAFMFGESVKRAELPLPRAECLEARMQFTGPLEGTLRLAVPAAMCPVIAANVLGLEPDDPEVASGAEDALKELLNITCGHVLTALAGEGPVFKLTVPEISRLDKAAWTALRDLKDTASFLVEEWPVLLNLAVDQ